MKRCAVFSCLIFLMLISFASLPGVGRGRVDVGPLWMRLKFQNDGETFHKVDMWGARVDSIILPFEGYGVCLKPFVFGAKGSGSDFLSYGGSLGHYTPITEQLTVVPLVGFSHTNMHTKVDVPAPPTIFENEKEKIESNNFFIGGELIFKLNPNWYLTLVYQYNWARVHTRIGDLVKTAGGSTGSNVGCLLDYYLNNCVSINLGFAYNASLDEERYGVVGYGFKTGLTYLF